MNEIIDSKGPMPEVIESETTESWSLELCTLTLLFCSSLPCRKLLEQAFDQALYEPESQVTYQIVLREPFKTKLVNPADQMCRHLKPRNLRFCQL